MDVKLVVVGGETKTTEVQLKLPTVVGRGKEASLTLPHPLVSRRHTEIYEEDGKLFVRDLGSLNGTFVNNERIEDASELPAGNLLTIGTVTFRAVYNGIDTAPATLKKTTAGKLTGGGTVVATKSATVQIDGDDSQFGSPGPTSDTASEEIEFADLDIGGDETESIDDQRPSPAVSSDSTVTEEDDEDLSSFLSGLD